MINQRTYLSLLIAIVSWTLHACQPASLSISTIQANKEASGSNELGKLILIDESPHPNHKLLLFDIESQSGRTLFKAPNNSWIYQVDLSRDSTQLALSYAPPPSADQVAYDRNGIYLAELNVDGQMSEPRLLFGNTAADEYLFNPIWSADNKSIFYVSYKRIPTEVADEPELDVALMRYDLKSAEHHLIARDGIWPRLSPQGDQLVFIQVEPKTNQRSIRITDLDGKNGRDLVSLNHFFDIDTPTFSADGEHIYFGAVPHSTTVDQKWWEIALGVQVASAHVDHNIPSDWWKVSLDGGGPERVTNVKRIISYGSFNPDGNHLFYATIDGIYSMSPDGTNDQRLPLQNSYRYFAWLP